MWQTNRLLVASDALLTSLTSVEPLRKPSISFRDLPHVEQRGIHNIHIDYTGEVDGELTIAYGSCETIAITDSRHRVGSTYVGRHPNAARHVDWDAQRPIKFTWTTPADVQNGCLLAFIDQKLVGICSELETKKRKVRRQSRKAFADVADPMGPWFDGVAYLKQKQANDVFVAAAKTKRFGILGAGISGLATGLTLDSVGTHNWEILESSDRLGGRMKTAYLNGSSPEEGQYHEMGPMRFSYEITDPDTNETYPIQDMKMVFQLADVLNEMNAGEDEKLQIEFIPWIHAAVVGYSNETAAEEAIQALEDVKGVTPERIKLYATNVFRAHKEAVKEGLFNFTEVEYLRKVIGTDLNTTDEVTPSSVVWPMWEYETVEYHQRRTESHARSLCTHGGGSLKFNAKVHAVKYNETSRTLAVSHRTSGVNPRTINSTTETFDYLFNSVPFNLLKFWELPPHSSLMRKAIDRTVFGGAAKMVIQYKTRFWEHLERPIIGGCGRVNSPLIGQICYPSWDVNATGPGVLIASYISDYDATVACSTSDEEHAAFVQAAMVSIHGFAAEENWTGNYERHCWEHDPNHAGAFSLQIVPQQQLYLPAFWRTECNTVYIGEHTSFTHSRVFSALESATRGTVQMLLDMGLVDEAKQLTEAWMARWIHL